MNLPRKVQNFIMCLISNLPDLKQSKSRISFFADIWKKFLNVSEFNFTLLRTSDMFCFTKTKSSGNYLRIFVTFAAYMFSSISDRAKLYHISLYGSDWDFSTIDIWIIFCEIYYDCQKKLFIILYIMTYFNIGGTICYKMHAPFLVDNSIEMILKNFSYTETNKARITKIKTDFQRHISQINLLFFEQLWYKILV